MIEKDRILDGVARVAGGTVSVLSGLKGNVRDDLKGRVDELALRLDLVPREDFERLEAVLSETRQRLEALEKIVAEKKA